VECEVGKICLKKDSVLCTLSCHGRNTRGEVVF
jgi:hypothetical protein